MNSVVPAPTSVQPDPSASYELTEKSTIHAAGKAAEAGHYLADVLRPSTGFRLPVTEGKAQAGDITLQLTDKAELGRDGYRLQTRAAITTVQAKTPSGLFNGIQSLRQMLPAKTEQDSVQDGPWTVPGGTIVDKPRFEHRGAMLDVSRHFFGVDQVKRYIDQMSLYKMNRLHLHLSDDQGWRLEIKSWPNLTKHGGSTEVGGGPGGSYTQEQYTEIVRYAASRNIMVVPEIDMPGHTNAALSSYAKLNCDGKAPPLYTGIEVGFSSLCVGKDVTYKFAEDVIREVAALTPGPYLHIGGDEAHETSDEDYKKFMKRVLPLVKKYGKTPIGWDEIALAEPESPTAVQYWDSKQDSPEMVESAKRGNKILLSPSNKTYLDMKYNKDTELGQDWAGLIEVRDAYSWDPGSYINNLPEDSIKGVEAPLWTETLETTGHLDFMAFPRLPAIAELGWSSPKQHDWNSFRERLAAQSKRWDAMGINYYRSPQVPWPKS